jgi:hypothetical protein
MEMADRLFSPSPPAALAKQRTALPAKSPGASTGQWYHLLVPPFQAEGRGIEAESLPSFERFAGSPS